MHSTLKLALVPVLFLAAAASVVLAAESAPSVKLSDVHLCCDKCVTGANTALKDLKATTSLTSNIGKSSNDAIKVSAETGAKDGKVKTLEVEGVHLCCGSCITAAKAVLSKVDGVKSDTLKANAKSFTVEGDFEPKALFAEFQKAGLTGHVATPATSKN